MSRSADSNRREFLQGKAALRALDEAAQGTGPAPLDVPAQPYLLAYGRDAMACRFQVYLNYGQHATGAEAALAGLELLESLEAQLTVYRETSEIVDINRHAGDGPVVVEPRLFELLQQSRELFEATDGAFDITAGPLVKVWGFYRRQGKIPDDADLADALERVGMSFVQLDPAAQTIAFTRAGMELNLGSIGKGYALDRCGELMAEAGVQGYLWHGGQSSVLARGSSLVATTQAEGTDRAAGWSVGIADPLNPQRRLGEVTLRDQALSTSGASVQFFRYQGQRYGHILDPRTGWPAAGVFSATAIAPTAAIADALSTAFYVLGPRAAQDYCLRHPDIGFVLVCPTSSGSALEVITAGLSEDQWRRTTTLPSPELRESPPAESS